MKKIFLLLTAVLMVILMGCGEDKIDGTLYTKDDIFVDCIKIDYPEAFTSKLIIIEGDGSLNAAIEAFPKLKSMPGFEEIIDKYPVENYTYVVEFIKTGYESETITCDGIIVNKERMEIRFKTDRRKKKKDTFGVVAGYILYAVFPKEELKDCNFEKQAYILYPGRDDDGSRRTLGITSCCQSQQSSN